MYLKNYKNIYKNKQTQTKTNIENEIYEKILKVYDLFEKYPKAQDELIRCRSVQFFNKYHKSKIPQLIDVYGFIKLLVNVFFDDSYLVFKEITKRNGKNKIGMNSKPFLYKIYSKILNDKRFNQSVEYHKRMIYLESSGEIFGFCEYWYSGGPIPTPQKKLIDNQETNGKYIYLQNFIIDKIIGYIMNDTDYFRDIGGGGEDFKQFFKVLSNQLINLHSFPLITPVELNNNNNNLKLVYKSPIEFDYELLKHIRYNTSEQQLNSIFSKVETFKIKSDEFDSCYTSYDRDIDEYYYTMDDDGEGTRYYTKSIVKDGYLIYPPQMPSLKNLIIEQYYGFEYNYSKLISHIIKINSNLSKHDHHQNNKEKEEEEECAKNSTNSFKIGTIEHFSIEIGIHYASVANLERESIVEFFEDLLKYHSSSLKTITIDFNPKRINLVLNLFQIFKKETITYKDSIKLILKIHNVDIDYNDGKTLNKLNEYNKNQDIKPDELFLFLKNQINK